MHVPAVGVALIVVALAGVTPVGTIVVGCGWAWLSGACAYIAQARVSSNGYLRGLQFGVAGKNS
jgi:hypothetical protein